VERGTNAGSTGPCIQLGSRGMEPFIAYWWATATTATE
jgi:hypothetical protein